MRNSELATQDWSLATIPTGRTVVVVAVRAERPEPLLARGVRPGARLVVEADAPFGGPRVVRLGRSRIAIDRTLAREVRVSPADGP